MDRALLAELHYLSAIDNLGSICTEGILSHQLATPLPHVDLSDPDMQDRRRDKPVAYAGAERPRKLHTYANVFLHGRNSMLKALCYRFGHETIAVLQVSPDVLDLPGVVIADQNAASGYARFFASPAGLEQLSDQYVLARTWGDETVDQIDYWRRKSRRSAEALVPERIEPAYLRGAYVSCEEARERCQQLALPFDVTVDPDLFFQ